MENYWILPEDFDFERANKWLQQEMERITGCKFEIVGQGELMMVEEDQCSS